MKTRRELSGIRFSLDAWFLWRRWVMVSIKDVILSLKVLNQFNILILYKSMSVINQNKIWNTISLSVCNFQGLDHVLNTSLSFFSCRTLRGISDIHLYFSIYLLFHFHLKIIFILTRFYFHDWSKFWPYCVQVVFRVAAAERVCGEYQIALLLSHPEKKYVLPSL